MSKHEVGFYDTFGFNDALFNEFLYPIMKDVGGKKMFKCDIKEKKDKYEIVLDVPSFKKEEIEISLKRGYLTVRCEHKCNEENCECEKEQPHFLRKERYCGMYERQFYVGDNVKEQDVTASLELGVLRIYIAKNDKKDEEPVKKIDIK